MLTGILLLLLLFLLLFAIPLTITFHLLWNQGITGHVKLGWANGLVQANIPIQPDIAGSDEVKPKRNNIKIPSQRSSINGMKLLRNKRFRERIVRYIRNTWNSVEKRNVEILMRIGLGDPADTGLLWATFGPLSAVLATNQHTRISLQPDFIEQIFELKSSGTIRIIPLRHLYLTARLLTSPTVWSGIHQAKKELA